MVHMAHGTCSRFPAVFPQRILPHSLRMPLPRRITRLADLEDAKRTDLRHRFLRGGLPPFFLPDKLPERDFQEWMDAYWAKDIAVSTRNDSTSEGSNDGENAGERFCVSGIPSTTY